MQMPIPHEDRTVLIGYNPHAGARDPRKRARIDDLCGALAAKGMTASLIINRDELASRATREYREGTLRCVVAAGGDGTVGDLINRLPAGLPLAVLPLGTENLLARHLKLPSDPETIAGLIANGKKLSLDAGLANGRVFLLMAGCGFDGEVVRRAHLARSGHITRWSYVKPILDAVRSYQYPEFTVQCRTPNGNPTAVAEHAFNARWLFVSNLPRYAGGLCFSPRASGHDSLLDVCAFQGRSAWSGIRYWIGVLTGRHINMCDCIQVKAAQIVVRADHPVPYQLDGDPGGVLPLTIDVLPARVTLCVPLNSQDDSKIAFAAERAPQIQSAHGDRLGDRQRQSGLAALG
jgi:diacylglycerol kinase family enzyme